MTDEQAFLQHILENPADLTARLVFADWLEERGDSRSELLRLQHTLTQQINPPNRPVLEARQRELLASGVKPVGPFLNLSIAKGIEMTFACIAPGTFLMGSPETELEPDDNEELHEVTLTKPFFMGIHQVTQEQWQAIMGSNPSLFEGENLPVEQVSWEDCIAFCKKLSERTGRLCTLPSEAQWEYACRAGTTTTFSFGEAISTNQANYNGSFDYVTPMNFRSADGEYREKTTPVGSFDANALGLFDMHGNLWDWCEDYYGNYAELKSLKDPAQSIKQSENRRVLRGGGWGDVAWGCRSAYRLRSSPDHRSSNFGFRVCLRLD